VVVPQRVDQQHGVAVDRQDHGDRVAVDNGVEPAEIKGVLGLQADHGVDAPSPHPRPKATETTVGFH